MTDRPHGPPGGATPHTRSDDPARGPHASGIGSREHIRHTLDRVRAAITTSRERHAHGGGVVARAESLATASADVLQQAMALRAQLRASVTAYVRHLYADGVPSERMLVLVKSAVREATPPELDPWEARDLMEDVVRWSVEAYYLAA